MTGKGVQQGSCLAFPQLPRGELVYGRGGMGWAHIFSLYRFLCPSTKLNFLLALLSAKQLNP